MNRYKRFSFGLLGLTLVLAVALAQAQIAATNKISDVRGTKHNLSAAADGSATPSGGIVPARTVRSTTETQVCVFCHTPHGATSGIVAPLWNRALSTATYTTYTSSSIEADAVELAAGPGGSSKLCLSCHDGTMAIDKVNVLNGAANVTITMTTAPPVKMPGMPAIAASASGFTRNLGTNLSNDHPISFTYNAVLAGYDGELRTPSAENTSGGIVMNRAIGKAKPLLPLENNQVQCTTCHDPHLRDKTTTNGNAKFLRANRFQVSQPGGGAFNKASDSICLACHDKGGKSWAYSAHANELVATQTYKSAAANLREFPLNAGNGPPVWQVGCLNCHDTHTVQGARRLLREGTDAASANLSTGKAGGLPALEETCYQCHIADGTTATTGSALNFTGTGAAPSANTVPNIQSDFTGTNKRMPITSLAQKAGTEVHDVGVFAAVGAPVGPDDDPGCFRATGQCGKDLFESRAKLGSTNLNNRHVECSDCHNPHRVIKGQSGIPGPLTTANTSEKAGTHKHEDATGYIHSNVISGVLRGSWGVEPAYPNNSFQSLPTAESFAVKRGDPGDNGPIVTSRPGAETYVTREYQICMKCHSNYAYPDDNIYPNSANRPQLGGTGLTSATRTSDSRTHTSYTNQAKEFQAPLTHAVTVGSVSLGTEGGAGAGFATNNHRSWHPVMAPTGRLNRAGSWLAPWNNTGALGTQTMYCSDCHGSNTAATTVRPAGNTAGTTALNENGAPWGPHGSANDFILKGTWNQTSGEGGTNTLCFKCHSESAYTGGGGTGFRVNVSPNDGHATHNNKIDTNMKCNFCHVAVPHGWKNRGLLVNLRDVGPEAGKAVGGEDVGVGPFTAGPYYRRAYLRIFSFPTDGNWKASDCGGAGAMKTQCETAS